MSEYKYDIGDIIEFDENYVGVTPRLVKGKIISQGRTMASKGDPGDIGYTVRLLGGRTTLISEYTITRKLKESIINKQIYQQGEELKMDCNNELLGVINSLNNEIVGEVKTVSSYNDTKQILDNADIEGASEVIDDIVSEENKHVGQLQAILGMIDADTTADIDAGREEGQDQLDDTVNIPMEPVLVDLTMDDGFVPSDAVTDVDIFADETLEADDLDESMVLTEKIPRDLANAYKKYNINNINDHAGAMVDFENADYDEITPEEAIALKKAGKADQVIAKIGDNPVRFYDDGSAKTYREQDADLNVRKNFGTLVKNADKLYKTNEDDSELRQDLANKRNEKSDQRTLPNQNQYHYCREIEKGTGRHVKLSNADNFYKNSLDKYKTIMANLTAKYDDGDISRNEYEKTKANYENIIADIEQRIKKRAIEQARYRDYEKQEKMRGAETVNMKAPIDRYKEIKRNNTEAALAAKNKEIEKASQDVEAKIKELEAQLAKLKADKQNDSNLRWATKRKNDLEKQLEKEQSDMAAIKSGKYVPESLRINNLKESIRNLNLNDAKSDIVVNGVSAACVKEPVDNSEVLTTMEFPESGQETFSKDQKFTLEESLFSSSSLMLKEALSQDEIDLYDDLKVRFDEKGFDVENEGVQNYIQAVADYITMARNNEEPEYSIEEWFKDTTENYPEDLDSLPRKTEATNIEQLEEARKPEDDYDKIYDDLSNDNNIDHSKSPFRDVKKAERYNDNGNGIDSHTEIGVPDQYDGIKIVVDSEDRLDFAERVAKEYNKPYAKKFNKTTGKWELSIKVSPDVV